MTIAELFQLVINNYPDQLDGLIVPEKEREVLDAIIAKLTEPGTGDGANRAIEGRKVFYKGPGYTYGVTAGISLIDGVLYSNDEDEVILDESDPTLRRVDNIVDTPTGSTFNKGTPDNPAIQPQVEEGQAFLTFIIVEPDTSAPAEVITEIVFDENDEWATSQAGQSSGNSIDFENTEQVLTGLVSAKFIEPRQGLRAIFNNGAPYLIDNTAKFIFNFYLPAQMNTNHNIQFDIIGAGGNTVIGGWQTLPIQKSNFNNWQTIVIEASDLNFVSFNIQQIWIRFTRTGGPQAYIAFWVDDVKIQTGVSIAPPSTPQVSDIIFPIIEQGKSKGIAWEGGTDKHSIYVEEDGVTQGGGGFFERTTWVFEISDNGEEIPEIVDRALWAFRNFMGGRESLFEIRREYINYFKPLLLNGVNILDLMFPDYEPSTGTILFDVVNGKPRKYGFTTAMTGNITFGTTGAKEGVMTKVKHNDTVEPTYSAPVGVTLILGGGEYVPDSDNYIYAICHKNDAGVVTAISYTIENDQTP